MVLNSGGSLTITHCTVRNFTAFLIADVTVSDNGGSGIVVAPQGAGGSAKGTLDHALARKNDSYQTES